jgi:hypothetical protein
LKKTSQAIATPPMHKAPFLALAINKFIAED